MSGAVLILFILIWAVFFYTSRKNMLFIAFTATLLYGFNQLSLINDINITWVYLLLFALILLELIINREKK